MVVVTSVGAGLGWCDHRTEYSPLTAVTSLTAPRYLSLYLSVSTPLHTRQGGIFCGLVKGDKFDNFKIKLYFSFWCYCNRHGILGMVFIVYATAGVKENIRPC